MRDYPVAVYGFNIIRKNFIQCLLSTFDFVLKVIFLAVPVQKNYYSYNHLEKSFTVFVDINNSKRFLRGGTIGEAFSVEEDAVPV